MKTPTEISYGNRDGRQSQYRIVSSRHCGRKLVASMHTYT